MLGIIDIWGPAPTLGGLVISGWVDYDWLQTVKSASSGIKVDNGSIRGDCVFCVFPREDVAGRGLGFLALLQIPSAAEDNIYRFQAEQMDEALLLPSDSLERYDENQLFRHVRHFLRDASPDDTRSRLLRLLERPTFTGSDTLDSLPWPVHFFVDRTYYCPPDGLLIVGWHLDPFKQVAAIRVCGAGNVCRLDQSQWVKIKRADVVEGFAGRYDMPDDMLGFMVFAAGVFRPDSPLYIEIETNEGRIVHKPFSASLRTGLSTVKEILSDFELRRDALRRGFDHVIGPAVAAINAFRLRSQPQVERIQFGAALTQPRASLIVPLYGRMDFLEYQLAFFHDTLARDHEILYVLDDPDRRTELLILAEASFARFERPFTILALSHNVGFAPANNIGLSFARGTYLCFLNSDIFPENPDWLECMVETASQADVGIVGAFLLYEDDTLQHDGCTLEPIPELGNWLFPMHPNKGLRRDRPLETYRSDIVTGACMVMRTEVARRFGGFDEGYIVGDFEDADLCKRALASGLSVVVDPRATLYHLERQSQNIHAARWRFNLTLYNAWRFQKKWFA